MMAFEHLALAPTCSITYIIISYTESCVFYLYIFCSHHIFKNKNNDHLITQEDTINLLTTMITEGAVEDWD